MTKTTLDQWRMFQAVADGGSFAQAAKALNKSQSTVHHAVHKLEQLLGVTLLEIQGRRAIVTETGELLLRRAHYLLEEACKMEAVAESASAGIEARLVIAVDQCFPQHPLYQVLDTVSATYPQLFIELRETVLSGANELLREGEVDLALSPCDMRGQLNEEICNVTFQAVACPAHPLFALPAPLGQEALRVHRQIVLQDSGKQERQDAGWLGSEQRWTVSHLRTSIALVAQGLGFAWLPLPAIEEHLRTGQLKPLPLAQGSTRNVPLFLNFLDGDRLGPVARCFIGELRYQTRDMPVTDDNTQAPVQPPQ